MSRRRNSPEYLQRTRTRFASSSGTFRVAVECGVCADHGHDGELLGYVSRWRRGDVEAPRRSALRGERQATADELARERDSAALQRMAAVHVETDPWSAILDLEPPDTDGPPGYALSRNLEWVRGPNGERKLRFWCRRCARSGRSTRPEIRWDRVVRSLDQTESLGLDVGHLVVR